jgi:two-component system sensor histidine kinase UhpB
LTRILLEQGRWAVECLLLAGLLCAVEVGLIRFGVSSVNGVVLVWPSAGLAIAGLAFLGPSRWPGVLLGSFATTWNDAQVLLPMLGLERLVWLALVPALADVGEALLGSWALGLGWKRVAWLRRTADVARFLIFAGLIGPVLNTVVSLTTLAWTGRMSMQMVMDGAQAWFVSGLIGSVVVTPALVVWVQATRREVFTRDPLKGLLALGAVLLFAVVAFGPVSQWVVLPATIVFAAGLLLLLWLASSWHQAGATMGLLAMTMVVVMGMSMGFGPVRGLLGDEERLRGDLLNLQLVIALVSASVLLAGAVASERATQQAALQRGRELLEDNRDRLNALGRRLLHELETTRQRLATRLHDGPTQQIALAQLALDEAMPQAGDWDRKGLQRAAEHLTQAMTETRAVMADLSPPVLGRLGLEAGLRALCSRLLEQHGEYVHLTLGLKGKRLAPEFEAFFYAAARELLHNAIQHAAAQRIELSLEPAGQAIEMRLIDDGRGMDAVRAMQSHAHGTPKQMSLYRLRQYVSPLGGSLRIDSRPGRTQVSIRLPIEPASSADAAQEWGGVA